MNVSTQGFAYRATKDIDMVLVVEALSPEFVARFWDFFKNGASIVDGVKIASVESLTCLKAKTYLNLLSRRQKGESVDGKHIKKHKADVFRLAAFLRETSGILLPKSVKRDISDFIDLAKDELPQDTLYKNMGLTGVASQDVYLRMKQVFETSDNPGIKE